MSKHLGRNPFEKRKKTPEAKTARPSVTAHRGTDEKWSKLSEWALIQIPAQSMLFALKAVLRVKGLFERE
jgi:hypothetical protein